MTLACKQNVASSPRSIVLPKINSGIDKTEVLIYRIGCYSNEVLLVRKKSHWEKTIYTSDPTLDIDPTSTLIRPVFMVDLMMLLYYVSPFTLSSLLCETMTPLIILICVKGVDFMNDEQNSRLTKKTMVGYIRVSTSEDRQKLGYDAQLRHLQDSGCTKYLYAETMSGKIDGRPEFNKAVKMAKKLAADGEDVTFVVFKLDRLARKMSTLLVTLEDLQMAGVRFKSLSENIDTSTPSGVLMMQLLAMFSEFEVNTTSARIKEALKQAKLEGKTLGRPAIDDNTQLKILQMYQNPSLTVKDIAKRCHVSLRTVYRIAKKAGVSRS